MKWRSTEIRCQRDVVAALYHAHGATLAEQALDRDGDVKLGPRLLGVQRREQTGAAGSENQDIGVEGLIPSTDSFSERA